MSWEGAGFVDHHAHLLSVAVGRRPACCQGGTTEEIRAWHHRVQDRWSTPMDEPAAPLEVHDGTRGAVERALEQARELGIVQLTEAGMEDWGFLEVLLQLRARRGDLPVRVRLLVASGIAEPRRLHRTGDPWLDVEGVKFYADGWISTRTAALQRPYEDDDDAGRGILFLDADTLARRMDPYAEQGWTIATHAIGDRAIAAVLDAYEKVYGRDCATARPRVEHAQVLHADLIRRMADLGVAACVQPGFAVADARDARSALGDRWDDAYRWDALLDAGVPVIAGSDHPVEPLAPLVGLQKLVVGGDGAATLPLDRALAIMTDAAAGTVVLGDDPHRTAEDELDQLPIEDVRPSA